MDLINELRGISRIIRARTIENSCRTSTPHLGSCLSCIDMLVAIYFHVLKIDPHSPRDKNRDRFILSKGHAAPALFQILALRGFYSEACLESYGQDGSFLGEHPPTPDCLPGIEAATGSLGHGLPIAVGIALAAKMQKKAYKTYVLLGDGECNEGSVWEAAMFAAAHKLSNLMVFIDFNKWQATDRSENVLLLSPLSDKWKAFGWDVIEINGNNMEEILESLSKMTDISSPLAVIAHTVKGSGISFMEDDNNWHYRIPNIEEVSQAKNELDLK